MYGGGEGGLMGFQHGWHVSPEVGGGPGLEGKGGVGRQSTYTRTILIAARIRTEVRVGCLVQKQLLMEQIVSKCPKLFRHRHSTRMSRTLVHWVTGRIMFERQKLIYCEEKRQTMRTLNFLIRLLNRDSLWLQFAPRSGRLTINQLQHTRRSD